MVTSVNANYLATRTCELPSTEEHSETSKILFWPMSYSTKSRSTQIKTGEFRLKILQGLCIKNRNAENHLLYATARTFQKPTDFVATVADKLSEASPKSYVLQLFRMKQ